MSNQIKQSNLPLVLLVEDDSAQRLLVERALRMQSVECHVVTVCDGLDAWELLNGIQDGAAIRPDLIFLDLNMPRLDGRGLLTRIKDDDGLSSIPVVMLTTSDLDDDKVECAMLGCDGYMVKPFGIRDLVGALEHDCRRFLTAKRTIH